MHPLAMDIWKLMSLRLRRVMKQHCSYHDDLTDDGYGS